MPASAADVSRAASSLAAAANASSLRLAEVHVDVQPRAAQRRRRAARAPTCTSLDALRLPRAATDRGVPMASAHARITSSGASVAARSASWIRARPHGLLLVGPLRQPERGDDERVGLAVAIDQRREPLAERRRSARPPPRAARPPPASRPAASGAPRPSPAATRRPRPRAPTPSRRPASARASGTRRAKSVSGESVSFMIAVSRESAGARIRVTNHDHVPRLMTARSTARPRGSGRSRRRATSTASICLPGSRLPIASARSSDQARVDRRRGQRLLERQAHRRSRRASSRTASTARSRRRG